MNTEPPVITSNTKRTINSCIGFAAPVSPSDSDDLPNGITRSLYVSEEGSVRLTLMDMDDGTYVDYSTIHAGRHPMFVKRVWSIGTTATVVAEY